MLEGPISLGALVRIWWGLFIFYTFKWWKYPVYMHCTQTHTHTHR